MNFYQEKIIELLLNGPRLPGDECDEFDELVENYMEQLSSEMDEEDADIAFSFADWICDLYYDSWLKKGSQKYNEIKKISDNLKEKNLYPDIIINNAAGNFLCPFNNLTENGWKRIIDIVLNGTFNIYHVFGREIISKKKKARNPYKTAKNGWKKLPDKAWPKNNQKSIESRWGFMKSIESRGVL